MIKDKTFEGISIIEIIEVTLTRQNIIDLVSREFKLEPNKLKTFKIESNESFFEFAWYKEK